MKRLNVLLVLLCALGLPGRAAPLRVLVAAESDAVRADYAAALQKAGAQVAAAAAPDAAALSRADVVLFQRTNFEPLPTATLSALADFARRGGGIVAVNAAVAAGDVAWGKAALGGAWDAAASRKFASRMMIYVRPDGGAIAGGASSFDVEDDTLYDLALADDVFVLGSAFTPKVTRESQAKRAEEERRRAGTERASVYDIQPQMWSWDGPKHRAVVFLQGAEATLKHASFRVFILRALAWTARRDNADELCTKADLADLRYPAGGPRRAADAIRPFEMQPGFRASVVAADPLISKPIAVQWDARGRLWVAETPEYPNGRRPYTSEVWKDTGSLEPGRYDRPARDSISVLEDTDGDGVMDKRTLFFEGLELVCGFCLHGDGVMAVSNPEIAWIRDTDGDGKADKVVPVFGGVPFPNHFIINHLIQSPDGWIYASSGTRFTPTKPGDRTPLASLSPGMIRFRADGSAIEQVGSVGGNSFGMDITSDLELFLGMATSGNPLQHVVLPEWVLAKAAGAQTPAMSSVNPNRSVARKDLPDRAPVMQISGVGKFSAACASLVYEGGAWPKEYDGTIFCTEPILDIIHHERLRPNGPTFAGELLLQDREWLRSTDYWFCPVDVAVGPDGAMYVLDFYTPVVAHNDTRGPPHGKAGASIRPDREHYFGRIYRIQHDAAAKFALPDLTQAGAGALVSAFKHPNRVVRFNALRVLMEKADTLATQASPALTAMADGEPFAPARILALWALHRMGRLPPASLAAAARAEDAGVRKNALLIAEAGRMAPGEKELAAAINGTDGRVRLAALRAMAASPMSAEAGALLLAAQAKYEDPWSRAAAAAAASGDPAAQLDAVLAAGDSSAQRLEFARSLAVSLAANGDASAALRVLNRAAKSSAPGLTAIVLDELGRNPPPAPADAAGVLRSFLSSTDRGLAAAAAPLAAAWDKSGALTAELATISGELLATAREEKAKAEIRAAAVRALLAMRAANVEILPGVIALLSRPQPETFRRELISALAATGEAHAGRALAGIFPGLPTTLRDAAFDALVGRPEWAALLLDAMEAKQFPPAVLGPAQLSRLSAHPHAATAARAKKLLAALGGGTNPAKDEIIARLRPVVETPGDVVKGRALFTAACSTCHQLGGAGHAFGPSLEGIGSHQAAELLMHIVDPNRAVDDEHRTWNIATKDGRQFSALMASENESTVKLRQPAGLTVELKTSEIASRAKAANSLMPEGLEALGAESLRDIIAYIQSVAPKHPGAPAQAGMAVAAPPSGATVVPVSALSGDFRALDLSGAFTADTRRGLYASETALRDTLPFVKFGRVVANGVPFDIANAATTANGKNVVVLRGGPETSFARTMPQRVEIPVGFAASRLHFLGGVGGWGGGGGEAMTVEIHFAGGQKQSAGLRTGREFADYIARKDVPGSQFAEGIVSEHQVRTFAIPLQRGEVIEKLVLESPAGRVAPTTVAITAELGPPAAAPAVSPTPAPAAPRAVPVVAAPEKNAPPKTEAMKADDPRTTAPMGQTFSEPKPADTLRVLLVGAGSAHDFPRYFLGADAVTLRAAGGIETAATPNLDESLALLPQADVLVLSANHGSFGSAAFQAALNKFADAGKGVVVLHAATWRNWTPATGYNRRFVGGGAKSHGHGTFAVTLRQSTHPLLRGVAATFQIKDENYHALPDDGAAVEVLAENAPDKGAAHPSVWIVGDAKARIACITLGHAAEAHSNPAFKTLLVNAVKWTGGK